MFQKYIAADERRWRRIFWTTEYTE